MGIYLMLMVLICSDGVEVIMHCLVNFRISANSMSILIEEQLAS
ncbi:hypothetical protein GPAL_3544 [Glaciecola pallidula DSM 14239 = ACAM 615]|uniref:Uncharacterized protein n=1 Tax=Brumicola pallidula DSM 14239 = ACAM 615 TaxID=1121922 RepID=K7A4I5_9ALTE|nr:hypothetical protein GPAL_3544 [Glaciecola pallidula DSM 14239 = ACAM 615]